MNQADSTKLPWRVRFLHNLARFSLRLLTRTEVHGAEKIPTSGVTMMIMNHLHWLDPVIGVAIVKRPAVMFTADKWEHRFVIGDVIRWSQRAIFVARGEIDRQALAQAEEVLNRGDVLALAPEGTRSKTGALQEARDGAAYLAARTGPTIVPVAAYGQELAERNWKRLRRPHIVVIVGEPFHLEGTPCKARGQQRALYTEEMMLRLARMLPPQYRGVYGDNVAEEHRSGVEASVGSRASNTAEALTPDSNKAI
jgi:1-acyl-sn-glycerol-3-phosphate acyltransferase